MIRMIRIIGLVIGLSPVMVSAALTVIYDSGDTQPIAPFLNVFESSETSLAPQLGFQSLQPRASDTSSISSIGAADLSTLLPIESPGLTLGKVQSRTHDKPFARPFFLIGSDEQSRQWLLDHRDQLKEISAVGMLVQAETMNDLEMIAELADGLSILPASASDIAHALGIKHYPVLISAHTIE